ncbi:MAG: NAD(P)H-dependent oxidoreductase subunit E, partial [Bacteroidales bacterium]|nr:NAD(P)H-dependent oxidoreductase subunit E [Bacteroidales bacterium]
MIKIIETVVSVSEFYIRKLKPIYMEYTAIRNERTQLLNYLWEFQDKNGYISTSDIRKLSKELGISWIEIEGVISFYHFFRRKPTGKYTVYLNNGMVSEIKGFQKIKEAFEKETGAIFGETDPTGTFSLFETSCIGLSDQEPAALINFMPFVNLTPKKVKEIVSHLKKGGDVEEIKDEVKDYVRYKNDKGESVLFREYKEGDSILKLVKKQPQEVIQEIKDSGLTGRGGAFFPTGLKWEFARHSQSMQKYVICNADEGEPGTFKDREIISQVPRKVLSGMAICAHIIGAKKGYIYLRAEYNFLKENLQQEINVFEKYAKELNIDFTIEIFSGAGAYVCGEESALIESMEGKRGEPRNKPPFPVTNGYLGKPTVVNNVETFVSAMMVCRMGASEYSKFGIHGQRGSKLFSISGDTPKGGVHELELGLTVQDLVDEFGDGDTKAVQVGG